MWPEYLRNKDAILGPFNGTPPAIDGLSLAQVVLHHPATIHTCFEYKNLPHGMPARWQAKRFDRLQLRFSFYGVSEVSFAGNLRAHPDRTPVNGALSNGAFNVAALNRSFLLSLRFEDAYGALHPYNDADALDQQPHLWFRGLLSGFCRLAVGP